VAPSLATRWATASHRAAAERLPGSSWVGQVAGGTLFLDEIGDLLPPAQTRLLHVLEQEAFQPARGNHHAGAPIRVIASTRHDLEREVREGRFREDLYYRLGVIIIDVPALAERRSDIPLLVERTLERLNRRGERTVDQVAPEALRILQAHDYPGNVRELENLLEHAFVVGQRVLGRASLLSCGLRIASCRRSRTLAAAPARLSRCGTAGTGLRHELGIHRSTLWRRMRGWVGGASGERETRSDPAKKKEA
jgi:DNA-binding NtrC family response regulator